MDREYDIFEKLSDGSLMWRAFARGRENAANKLEQLSALSPNEHFAIHTPSEEIVARVNVPGINAVGSDWKKIL
jgi:hypothetical protein